MEVLQGVIRGNMKEHGIKIDELAGMIGKSSSQTYNLIRSGKIMYKDLRIIADCIHMTPEQKERVL